MDPARQYSLVAATSAQVVIRQYSSSFWFASRLLPTRARSAVASIYALVRVADETVDGACPPGAALARLDALEAEVHAALDSGFSANMVVHAFCDVARTHGIGEQLIAPFFASMRMDLTPQAHTGETLSTYIYGSAQVIGLMCLRVFVAGQDKDFDESRDAAMALGSAFQKINFLRDLAADSWLGRRYIPGATIDTLTPERWSALVAAANRDLEEGYDGVSGLPADTRRAVYAAADIYRSLLTKLAATPLTTIRTERVRLGARAKATAVLSGATLRRLHWVRWRSE